MFSFSNWKIHNITEGRESELCYEFTLDLFTLVFLKEMFWTNVDSFSNSFLSVHMTLKIHARRVAAHVHRLFHFVFLSEGFWLISLVFFRTAASKTVASVLYTFYFLWNTIGSVDPKRQQQRLAGIRWREKSLKEKKYVIINCLRYMFNI